MPSAINPASMPDSSSPTLQLVQANEVEMVESSMINAASWRGPLDVSAYLEREAHLRDADLARNGGITYWILVDTADPPSDKGTRRILASCETLKKRALVARSGGVVKETVSHGIGSVHCSPAYRGRGYAQRMLTELAKILDTWQQKEGQKGEFSALWSDIGKRFYARLGWNVFASSHISLPPKDRDRVPEVTILTSKDLGELCRADEAMLKSAMAKLTAPDVGACVTLIPDVATMQWHHAREEFLGPRLCKRFPSSKGALAKTTDGRRVWCIWTRTFGATPDEYVLNVLRLVLEGEDSDGWRSAETRGGSERDAAEHAIAAILEAAQLEASHWGMSSAEFWNPSHLTISAAKKIEPSVQIVDRDDESITSLRWHGEPLPAGTKIEWVANEKYAWC